jgi:hypothetical protein
VLPASTDERERRSAHEPPSSFEAKELVGKPPGGNSGRRRHGGTDCRQGDNAVGSLKGAARETLALISVAERHPMFSSEKSAECL